MAKFLNKKEQVIDFQLTPYGNYLLSTGIFKPAYYAFYDSNILYDKQYVRGTTIDSTNPNGEIMFRPDTQVPVENQNEIHDRIKNKTQYLEGLLVFTGLEKTADRSSTPHPTTRAESFDYDTTVIKEVPDKDIFKFDSAIGDARFDGTSQQHAPGWKIVALQGQISSSATKDVENNQLIPQINIDMIYSKEIKDIEFDFEASQISETIDSIYDLYPVSATEKFSDGKTIVLSAENVVVYTEELNTELLTENFDIEVYEILDRRLDAVGDPIDGTSVLKRKFFEHAEPQVVDGLMVRSTSDLVSTTPSLHLTASTEYYFDIYADKEVNKQIACRGASIFNKNSYYVDIDFECEEEKGENVYYDIYGRATDPEICQI